MDLLVARTGLTLNPGQMADLVLAWRQLAGLIAAIPRQATLADDQAFVFRLPPPAGSRQPPTKAAARSRVIGPKVAEPKAKPVAKAEGPAKTKAAKTKSGKTQSGTSGAVATRPPAGKPATRKRPAKPVRQR